VGGREEMGHRSEDDTRGADYLSYLLRLWQESGDDAPERREGPVWRASLTSPTTGERVGFASLEGLVAYLQARTDTTPSATEKAGSERR
jgi:hypothetical protein